MNLAHTISTRFDATRGRDPDTLHGLLYIVEQGASETRVGQLLRCDTAKVFSILDRAREGHSGRVPSVNGDGTHARTAEDLPGLFPRLWKRTLIGLMLRPDGATTAEVEETCAGGEFFFAPAAAIYDLRRELKIMGVDVESKPTGEGFAFRYRIVGQSNWRMQKIIANGWAL